MPRAAPSSRSSFGNCTSLRLRYRPPQGSADGSQFLRELHFIEVGSRPWRSLRSWPCSFFGNCTSLRPQRMEGRTRGRRRSSFGNCTSLRPVGRVLLGDDDELQFLRELHFIEASTLSTWAITGSSCSSFGSCTSLRQVRLRGPAPAGPGRSSFGNCTSLRSVEHDVQSPEISVAVPSGTALH